MVLIAHAVLVPAENPCGSGGAAIRLAREEAGTFSIDVA
jgi:hypothetical protein